MSVLLYIPLSDELVGFHVMAEVTVFKEDSLDFRQIREREE